MNRPMQSREQPVPSLVPSEGWHCSHFFYLFDRAGLETLPESVIDEAVAEVKAVLDPAGSDAPVPASADEYAFFAAAEAAIAALRARRRRLRARLTSLV